MGVNGYALNVGGLFALANDVLGGVITIPAGLTCGGKPVTACAIQSAVDMINNAFDECRLFVGYLAEKFACPSVLKVAITQIGDQNLKVYPNPFNDKVTFEFTSAIDGHAVLEIQNVLGQKVATLMNKQVEQGVLNRVDYRPNGKESGIFFYRLMLDNSVMKGKIIYNK